MAQTKEIIVTLPGGRRVDAQVGHHVIHTDQPLANGGEDSAPSPFEIFLGALGACAGIFVEGFCTSRKIPTRGIRIVERLGYGDSGVLNKVDLELQLPADFPARYHGALVRAVEQCSVKRVIQNQPAFEVRVGQGAGALPQIAI